MQHQLQKHCKIKAINKSHAYNPHTHTHTHTNVTTKFARSETVNVERFTKPEDISHTQLNIDHISKAKISASKIRLLDDFRTYSDKKHFCADADLEHAVNESQSVIQQRQKASSLCAKKLCTCVGNESHFLHTYRHTCAATLRM